MKEISIEKLLYLNDEYKEKSMELFIEGFGHIYLFIKDRNILKDFLLSSMDFSMVYVALYQSNIMDVVDIVPAGVLELVEKQSEGYAYTVLHLVML